MVALAVAVGLFTRFSFDDGLDRDEAIYAYGAQQFAEGRPPYVSIFDPKAPFADMAGGAAVAVDRALPGRRDAVDDLHAIRAAHAEGSLQKVTYLSSSMVFESASDFPSREGDELRIPPPGSSYGFQKLALAYFARTAHAQHGLPFTIVRPFNCVGIGETRARTEAQVLSGNVKLALSHVVPDLVQKLVKGQDPLHILGSGEQVRHYTYGGDLARGIVAAMERPAALNEDFNLSTETRTTVLELAQKIWTRLRPGASFRYVTDPPFEHDVQKRIPSVEKARRVLGFEATTTLDETLDEVVPWIEGAVRDGLV